MVALIMVATAIDAVRPVRRGDAVSLIAFSLLLTPYIAARAAEIVPQESTIRIRAISLGAAVKHDAKAVGAGCKESAHRVAVAAKSVGHEIATAAKRGAAETRAAFRGGGDKSPAT